MSCCAWLNASRPQIASAQQPPACLASKALEWAIREAALRRRPLTVLTVHQAVANYWTGSPVVSPGDPDLTKKALEAAYSGRPPLLWQVVKGGREDRIRSG